MLKHRSGASNKVADALSRRHTLLTEMRVNVVGFEEMATLYPQDEDFKDAWNACTNPTSVNKAPWKKYFI